jgi:hypothetical protein
LYGSGYITYLGHGNNNNSIFTIPIAAQYTVTKKNVSYRYAVEHDKLPLQVYTGPAPKRFKFDDWAGYPLYRDGVKGQIYKELPLEKGIEGSIQPFKEPYSNNNGIGTVVQVAGVSSAFFSDFTGAISSYFAQKQSYRKWLIENSTMSFEKKQQSIRKLERTSNFRYSSQFGDDLATCASWPEPCRRGDTRIIDGGLTDGPSTYTSHFD